MEDSYVSIQLSPEQRVEAHIAYARNVGLWGDFRDPVRVRVRELTHYEKEPLPEDGSLDWLRTICDGR